jgi:cell division protein FtsI/penicillin-binding protein 2
MDLPGVTLVDERWRYYPGTRLGSHVIGFVGWKGDTQSGRYGLENYYNDVLERADDTVKYNFFAEIFGDLRTDEKKGSDLPGDIVVTIEPTVQLNLEKTLASFSREWSPETTGGIIMNPKTGEILAMAAFPDFDPNNYSSESNPAVYGNPLVESVFEMGSIMKPVTVAAGLDAGVITPASTYDDKGFLEMNGEKISNFDKKGRGITSMQEVLNQSLNTGAAYVALKLGHEKFSAYMRSFGIGEETGIDLPNELRGLTKNLDSTRDIERATASYGQGIAVTPIMMARALSVLGNGGILVNPHLIKEIRYKVGFSKHPDYSSTRRVISAKASEDITRMLVTVVDKALMHGDAKLPRYSIAAKTGTAQVANPAGGGYFDDRYLHSFFGYFPAYDPKFLVFLFTVYPKNVTYASQTLTKPFLDTTKFLLSYYEVPPDR